MSLYFVKKKKKSCEHGPSDLDLKIASHQWPVICCCWLFIQFGYWTVKCYAIAQHSKWNFLMNIISRFFLLLLLHDAKVNSLKAFSLPRIFRPTGSFHPMVYGSSNKANKTFYLHNLRNSMPSPKMVCLPRYKKHRFVFPFSFYTQ